MLALEIQITDFRNHDMARTIRGTTSGLVLMVVPPRDEYIKVFPFDNTQIATLSRGTNVILLIR